MINRIFIWQWGRFGAGPRIALELSEALRKYCNLKVGLSLSKNAEIQENQLAGNAVDYPIETYEGFTQFVIRSLFIRHRLKPVIDRLEISPPEVALAIMPGYWDIFLIWRLQRMGVPVAVIIHDAANRSGEGFQLIHFLQKQIIKNADAIITLSDYVANQLRVQGGLDGKPIYTIAHAALEFGDIKPPGAVLRKKSPDEPLKLLVIGRLRRFKGVEVFLQAVSQIEPSKIEVKIAGSINDSELLAKIKNSPQVDLHSGWLSESEIIAHLDWCDCVVLPYNEATQSGVIPSAFARAKPVIVTPVGGLPEQVENEKTGLICHDTTHTALAQAINIFINDPDLLYSCATGAYHTSKNEINWQVISHQFTDAFIEITG